MMLDEKRVAGLTDEVYTNTQTHTLTLFCVFWSAPTVRDWTQQWFGIVNMNSSPMWQGPEKSWKEDINRLEFSQQCVMCVLSVAF